MTNKTQSIDKLSTIDFDRLSTVIGGLGQQRMVEGYGSDQPSLLAGLPAHLANRELRSFG